MKVFFKKREEDVEVPWAMLAALIASILVSFISISLARSFSDEEAVLIYNAALEVFGRRVFADYFNMSRNPPGMLWLTSLVALVFREPESVLLALRGLSIVLKAATALVFYALAYRLSGNKAVAAWTVALFSCSGLALAVPALINTETFSLCIGSFAVLIAMSSSGNSLFHAGMLIGAATLFSERSVLYLAVAYSAAVFGKRSATTHPALQMVTGFIVGMLPLIGYLTVYDAWSEFSAVVFSFDRFSPQGGESFRGLPAALVLPVIFEIPILIYCVALGAEWRLWIKGQSVKLANISISPVLVWLGLFGGAFLAGRSFQNHYLYELTFPFYFVLACFFVTGSEAFSQDTRKVLGLVLGMMLSAALLARAVFPIETLTDFDAYLAGILRGYRIRSLVTDQPQFLVLTGANGYFFWGPKEEEAYLRAGLGKFFGSRASAGLAGLVEDEKPDAVYAKSSYLPASLAGYTRQCALLQERPAKTLLRRVFIRRPQPQRCWYIRSDLTRYPG